jgi:methyltransferase (TIGR00027 family)
MTRTRPSRTAIKVARTLVYLGRDPALARLLPDGAAAASERLLSAAGQLPPAMRWLLDQPWLHRVSDRVSESLGAPPVHLALRKRFVENEMRDALAGGARQVLVAGAGYDTLCLRLAPEFAARLFVEVDHPSTHHSKRAGVEAMGATRPNLHLLGVDLGDVRLEDALGCVAGWDAGADTVIVAEAVLMYLREAAVRAFFDAVRTVTGPGSRVVFTWARGAGEGRPDVGRFGRFMVVVLRLAGEPIHWCLPDTRRLQAFLAQRGFRLEADAARLDLGRHYLAPAGLDPSRLGRLPEHMAVAERV